ncbi:hypothetical protein TSUD_49890 [Trifolium subterraneum]|uniref:Uncharacterized protein n=1 Tax=Trifolium subterraneum TaxID=3900 RepID=A0A2Z6N8W9_TRISU|nr:hypothetical protein TSUD_49890 [Trifolium subterraneum]
MGRQWKEIGLTRHQGGGGGPVEELASIEYPKTQPKPPALQPMVLHALLPGVEQAVAEAVVVDLCIFPPHSVSSSSSVHCYEAR